MHGTVSDWKERFERVAARAKAQALETDANAAFPGEATGMFLAEGLGGLVSAREHGGLGGTLRDAAQVVERLASECGSTAMIAGMHYCAAAVIEAFGSEEARRAVAGEGRLATLAFSEAGSRSHFWAPVSTARQEGDEIVLDAAKSWVTSASSADFYVWSSGAARGEGSSIWLVPSDCAGLSAGPSFDGLGLRGNDSTPVTADGARIPAANLLGEDGKGADLMLGTVLPVFSVLNSAAALGLMRGALSRSVAHVSGTTYQHTGDALSQYPTIRAYLARMQIRTDMVGALLEDAISAIEEPSEATMLQVLEIKAAAGESATEVTDLAMRVCGGAAFRKEAGVERMFRDARAMTVMAPTTDQLYDFIGRAVTGLPLFD